MEAALFRPTWQQALGRGLYLGAVTAVVLITTSVILATAGFVAPPVWMWPLLAVGTPAAGALAGLLVRPRFGTELGADGIRTVTLFGAAVEPWSSVVDLRAERRGARTVVSVYLDSGSSVQLQAPYSGELFAADPQFELKVFALSHQWRSHRFGGVPT
ncbi:hypothetical protein [Actinoplanes sp. NPDC051494]|uniref:hypothetical protein n=1 Tax=Actinoplanes sp. NPDC051494 TaxID=3363907 RepID=UPI00378C149F